MSTTWQPEYFPSTQEIRDAFSEEVAALGGSVPDVYHDELRFLARAVLPAETYAIDAIVAALKARRDDGRVALAE